MILCLHVQSWADVDYPTYADIGRAIDRGNVTACLVEAFTAVGSVLHSVEFGGNATASSTILITAANASAESIYAESWAQERSLDGVPYALFRVTSVRKSQLSGNWVSLAALMAARRCFAADLLVYSGIDTLVDLPEAVRFAAKSARSYMLWDYWPEAIGMVNPGSRPLTISWRYTKYRPGGVDARTNVLLFRPQADGAWELLETWYRLGLIVHEEVETVFNELYSSRPKFRSLVHLEAKEAFRTFEVHNCGNATEDREQCMAKMPDWSAEIRNRIHKNVG